MLVAKDDYKLLNNLRSPNSTTLAHFLLLTPRCFNYAVDKEPLFSSCVDQFIRNQLNKLRPVDNLSSAEHTHPNDQHPLSLPPAPIELIDSDEIELYLIMIKHLIIIHAKPPSNDLDRLHDIQFLLSIPAIKARAHEPIYDHDQRQQPYTDRYSQQNKLLRLAINLNNKPVADILLSIPHVYDLALQHNFYQTDDTSEIDRHLLAKNHQPAIPALCPDEQRLLSENILWQLKRLIPVLCPSYSIGDQVEHLKSSVETIITTPEARLFLTELTQISLDEHSQLSLLTNTPLLCFLCLTKEENKILHNLLNDTATHLLLMNSPLFLDKLFKQQLSGTTAATSAFYWLTKYDLFNMQLLNKLEDDDEFTKAFIEHPDFFPSLLTRHLCEPSANSSTFWNMATAATGRRILNILFKSSSFQTSQINQYHFVDTLFAQCPERESIIYVLVKNLDQNNIIEYLFLHYDALFIIYNPQFLSILLSQQSLRANQKKSSLLYLLTETEKGINILKNLLNRTCFKNEEIFKTRLKEHPEFISTLLARQSIDSDTPNTSPLFNILSSKSHESFIQMFFVHDIHFKNKLINHPDFLPTMLSITHKKNSILSLMLMNRLLSQNIILKDYFSRPETIVLIGSNHQTLHDWCEALFTTIKKHKNFISVFFLWFSSVANRSLLKQLMENEIIQTGMLNHLGLKNTGFTIKWLFENEEIFSLINVLICNNLLELLENSARSPALLLNNPRVQQLIHLRQLDANYFLLIAAAEAGDGDSFIKCLNNPICSPWALTMRGYSLADFITNSALGDSTKQLRQEQLNQAIIAHSKQISEHNLAVHLHQLGTIHTEVPDKNSPLILPKTARIFTINYRINDVSNDDIQLFNLHIEWIISQPKLNAYHLGFYKLSYNETIRQSANDFLAILNTLQHLCSWINYYLLKNRSLPEPYPNWESTLGLCTAGVQTALQEMRDEFSNQSALKTYIQQAFAETAAYYNSLFLTKSGMEVHIPQNAIKSTAGLISTLSAYDAYITDWNTVQRQWAAQRMMDLLIHKNNWIDALIEPLQISPSLFLLAEHEGDAVLNMENPETLTTLNQIHTTYQRSPLFDNTFNLRQFYSLISNTSEEDECHLTSITLRPDLQIVLTERAMSYLHHSQLLTDTKVIQMYSELLWKFLTHPEDELLKTEIHLTYDGLLTRCASAIDGLALIKYCLLSHQSRWAEININNLHYAPKGVPTIFILLISNPFYLEDLFGFKFTMSDSRIEFKPAISALSTIGEQLKQSDKTNLALESVLHQPGSLFFWLYYFQADPLRTELFEATIAFALNTPRRLRTYDALIPLLIDLYQSPSASAGHKVLVSSFLQARLDEQLKAEHESFLQTSCVICMLTTPADPNDIMSKIRENSWLVNSLKNPTNWNAFCYLVNENQAMLNEARRLMTPVARNPHAFFPESAPSQVVKPNIIITKQSLL
jgi:hypothetical protein